jgi:DNA-binding Xre family transcriptional regulator
VSKLDYNKIKNYAAAKRIPIKELARRCDLSEQGFHYMLKKQTMRVDTLERICDTLEITMVDLFEGNLDSTTTLGMLPPTNTNVNPLIPRFVSFLGQRTQFVPLYFHG